MMKKYNIYLLLVLSISLAFTGCDGEEESEVLKNRKISGTAISVSGFGKVQGEPEDWDNIAESDLTILANELNMEVSAGAIEDESLVSSYEVVKVFNGGEEISVGTYDALPFTVSLTEIDEFLEGTSATVDDLKIGDLFTFTVKVHQTNGDVFYYQGDSFNLIVNCYADLSGTYTVTNSVCGEGSSGTIPSVTITETPDGSWQLETADGGLLQYCTSNTGLVNGGIISVICGEVSSSSSDTDFCPDYGIGCITGGTWDQETGVLELQLNDDFFGNGDYTATYVRQ
ncbi:hypothetical protein [Pseudozobellia thermophila]|uniref:DUF5689 domain-containing protein n=1 Tax=Pseudozobellia thermophila TaxID=192903 RepID=A0A1M6LVD2_9FLAO|nr:hypothetical protein [Pseudozobellia thermophila]SHJ75141.1 hypothetical protein SAMN04488513_10865 [Pseudozobellia thermophila]